MKISFNLLCWQLRGQGIAIAADTTKKGKRSQMPGCDFQLLPEAHGWKAEKLAFGHS